MFMMYISFTALPIAAFAISIPGNTTIPSANEIPAEVKVLTNRLDEIKKWINLNLIIVRKKRFAKRFARSIPIYVPLGMAFIFPLEQY